ncbi:MAG: hypothetical protein WDW38_009586 [Sanguina aurantia]
MQLLHGRPVGTLGHEAELRRLRRSMVPKKLIATLYLGSWFGGGPRLMGDGELQSCLKVTATEQVTTYSIEISQFFRVASPALIRAMRDDVTFKLTYYYGRLGAIGMDTVVGHNEAALHSGSSSSGSAPPPPPGDASTSNAEPGSPRGRAGSVLAGHGGANRSRKGNRKASAPGIVPGAAGGEAGRLGQAMQEAQAQADGGAATPVSLLMKGTPAERFWASPIFSGSAHSTALLPLLSCIYPEGLAPLAAKVGELVDRHIEKTDGSALLPLSRPITSLSNNFSRGGLDPGSLANAMSHSHATSTTQASPQSPTQQLYQQQQLLLLQQRRKQLPAVPSSPGSPGSPSHHANMKRQIHGGGGGDEDVVNGWANGAWGGGSGAGFSVDGRGVGVSTAGSGFRCQTSGRGDVSAGAGREFTDSGGGGGGGGILGGGFAEHFAPQLVSRDARQSHAGCLAAASIMWQRLSENTRQPGLRQCLTYDEIQSIKVEEARLMAVPAARDGRERGRDSGWWRTGARGY